MNCFFFFFLKPLFNLSLFLSALKILVFVFSARGRLFFQCKISLIIDQYPEGEWLKILEFILCFFSLSPIDFLVEKNRSMDVASW